MANSRALLVQGEAIEDSERVVTSALGAYVWASLPQVSDGSAATVDDGFDITIFANSTGAVELVDFNGNRVTVVRPFTQVSLRSRDNTRSPWEILRPGQEKGLTITDLAVTDPATAAVSAAAFNATYVEATVESEVDARIVTAAGVLETAVALSFAEMELKVNHAIAALSAMGLIQIADISEGTDTLALADNYDWQLVDDSERTVTSARATITRATLPEIEATGAALAVPPGHTVRFTSTAAGGIEIRDFRFRRVGFCPAFQSITVRASEVANGGGWANLGSTSESDVKSPAPKVAPIAIVNPTIAAPASAYGAAYTNDATFNTALDVAVDAAFDGMDTTTATAFAAFETTINALLVAVERLDVVADA